MSAHLKVLTALAIAGTVAAAPAVWSQTPPTASPPATTPGQTVPSDASPDPMAPTPPPAVAKPDEPMNTPTQTPQTAAPVSVPGPAQEWQATVSTSIGRAAPLTTVVNVCVRGRDPQAAANRILAQYCGGGTVVPSGNSLSWTGTCMGATGSGALTYTDDRQSFSGDIHAGRAGRDTHLHVDAHATGACPDR